MCVDYRKLNKDTLRDNYPLPLIEDLLELLRNKKLFSILDLKSGFHQIKIEPESTKYTSFVTPNGQYEYKCVPFGLCNAPAVFQRYVNKIFKPLIDAGKLCVYIDDILIFSETYEDHLTTLEKVFQILSKNLLELNISKCKFFQNEIDYLGYTINSKGRRPNKSHIEAVSNFPEPKNIKDVQRFLGLTSYFRKFIQGFATIARPLYDLLKKNSQFKFDDVEKEAFEKLKNKLITAPILAIYNPKAETQLHCDASSYGFGAILLQKQNDNNFHPISFFSKKTDEFEKKLHSFELETLAVVYAVKRFHVYLSGIEFKILTDCNALAQTLEKKEINPKIGRWALFLDKYHKTIDYRSGHRMQHVDALSRQNMSEGEDQNKINQMICVLNIQDIEQNIILAQEQDEKIKNIKRHLEINTFPGFELQNGILFRKHEQIRLLVIPKAMIDNILRICHDQNGHIGVEKTMIEIKKHYWFSNMKKIVKKYILNCLSCIFYSPLDGKKEGFLKSIDKGNEPFNTIHMDHYGPIKLGSSSNYKYILVIIDGFTKFVKFYATKTTNTDEVIKCLQLYMNYYSKPMRIITDRGTCFTSRKFENFLECHCVEHIKTASYTPEANGQAERVNRTLTPMLAKLIHDSNSKWDTLLTKIEYIYNNTFNRSIKNFPSMLLFGKKQANMSLNQNNIETFINNYQEIFSKENLETIREKANRNIENLQNYSKSSVDKKRKNITMYKEGDFIVLKKIATHKLAEKFQGPYVIKKVLPNDRFLITDIEGFQVSSLPFESVCSPNNMKKWLSSDYCVDEDIAVSG